MIDGLHGWAGRILRVDLTTGQVLTVADGIDLGRPGAWHPDGSIFYTESSSTPSSSAWSAMISRVSSC